MANRGVWDAIASAGPAVSFAHDAADVDEYLGVLDGSSPTSSAEAACYGNGAAVGGAGRAARRRRESLSRRRNGRPAVRATLRRADAGGAGYARASGSSNASLACDSPVFASGYSPEKQASQCVSRVPPIAS